MNRLKKVCATAGSSPPAGAPDVNFMYNLLFCGGMGDDSLPALLTAHTPDKAALSCFANDDSIDGRMRAYAYNRLAALGARPSARSLLGVVVEVPLDGGLDVLSVFRHGGVRYLNPAGKLAIFDGDNTPVAPMARALLAVAEPVMDRIGPWNQQRLPPPMAGNVGITFLVSDGLYFGEGPFAVLRRDPMAGPILAHATQMLRVAAQAVGA